MKLFQAFLDLVYPPRCMFCHEFIPHGRICERCSASLPVLENEERRQKIENLDACSSLFYYEGDTRDSLLRYKFHGLRFYSEEYALFMLSFFTLEETDCDLISWVPLSRRRRRSRGYDQSELIARSLARYLGLPCSKVLKKVRNVAPQSRTGDAAARKKNIAGAYCLYPGSDIQGKSVLLIDDIVTTGSTLSECAATLRIAGAASVKALTVARRKSDAPSMEQTGETDGII